MNDPTVDIHNEPSGLLKSQRGREAYTSVRGLRSYDSTGKLRVTRLHLRGRRRISRHNNYCVGSHGRCVDGRPFDTTKMLVANGALRGAHEVDEVAARNPQGLDRG